MHISKSSMVMVENPICVNTQGFIWIDRDQNGPNICLKFEINLDTTTSSAFLRLIPSSTSTKDQKLRVLTV